MGEFTTIQITKKLKEKLDRLKISKRDTYNQVIEDLVEDTFELSDKALKDLKEALEDVKNGRLVSHEEIKNELGIWFILYQIRWTNKARSQIKKLPLLVGKRIIRAIDELVENPNSKDVRKLKGTPYYRMRIGDYRVIFDLQKKQLLILILSLGNRKNIYK